MEWKLCIQGNRRTTTANTVDLDLRIRKVVFDLLKFNWLQGTFFGKTVNQSLTLVRGFALEFSSKGAGHVAEVFHFLNRLTSRPYLFPAPGFPPRRPSRVVIFIAIKTSRLQPSPPRDLGPFSAVLTTQNQPHSKFPPFPLRQQQKCRPALEVTAPPPATRPSASTHSPPSPPTPPTPAPPSVPRPPLHDTIPLILPLPRHQLVNKKWRWGQCMIIS